MAEHQIVDLGVVGSSPIRRPLHLRAEYLTWYSVVKLPQKNGSVSSWRVERSLFLLENHSVSSV